MQVLVSPCPSVPSKEHEEDQRTLTDGFAQLVKLFYTMVAWCWEKLYEAS